MADSKLTAPEKLIAHGKAARDLAMSRLPGAWGSDTGVPAPDHIGIYLNDHLAAATAGEGLAYRAAAGAKGTSAAADLRRIAAEITQDRAALLQVMADLDVSVRRYKVYAAWAGEKAGRLKFNGHLVTRSPLSDLEEAEFLLLSTAGKISAWQALRALADYDTRLDQGQLDELLARARRQSGTLEILRGRAVTALIATRSPAAEDQA